MDDRNDRRRDRLSWAEVDKLRDKSKSLERDPMAKQSSPAAMNAQKSYRAALERAFASGKVDELAKGLVRPMGVEETRPQAGSTPSPPRAAAVNTVAAEPASAPAELPAPVPSAPKDPDREHKQKLLTKVREAEGRDAISRCIDAYLGKYPKLPDDVEILTKALGHKSDERVLAALEQVEVLCTKDKPRRARTLVAQLRILEDTHGDADIRAIAGRIRTKL